MHRTILVIDHDALYRELLCDRLRSEGYGVFSASDGVTGLRAFYDYAPDLVLTELRLRPPDGFSLIETLRERGSRVPIVVVSGLAGGPCSPAAVRAVSLGADAVLCKPVPSRTLLSALGAHRTVTTGGRGP